MLFCVYQPDELLRRHHYAPVSTKGDIGVQIRGFQELPRDGIAQAESGP
jgi:hypothetical protein